MLTNTISIFKDGINIFPAYQRCNDFNPHSKWHQQAAAGLLDLIFLGDDLHRMTSPSKRK